jgi:chemotaxis protein methyltransferase CheR
VTRPLRGDELERLRLAVARRLGLQLEDAQLEQLERTAAERLSQRGSPVVEAWLTRVEAGDVDEVAFLAERLTVGETYFFRNANDLRAFVEAVLPSRMAARHGERRLRLLSAGCSSGEEPYTLAMLVQDFPALTGWDVAVRGVDVNPAALAKARSARYPPWSLRQTAPEARDRFFEVSGREFVVGPAVRAMVTFDRRNLVEDDPALWVRGEYDAVFCRNVTMYFAPEVSRRVVDRVASSLAPGGFLFLGHAETLRGVSSRFHLRHSHGTFYYQLREGAEEADDARSHLPASADARRPAPVAAGLPRFDAGWSDAIHAATQRVAALTDAPSGGPPPEPAAAGGGALQLAQALDLARQERYADALALLAVRPVAAERDPDALLLRAVVLASSGQPEQAEACCARVLALDELSAEAHYVMALCREHAGDGEGARNQDQYALYLDPTFAMPRLHLGLMAQRAGDREAARNELARALALLAGEDASRVLLLGGGFSRDALVELCRAELRAAGGAA